MAKVAKTFKTIKYEVNCKPNDSVDIKCGGPVSLGFDFYVDKEKPVEEIVAFIKKELKKNNLPLMSIITREYRFVSKLWTKKDIVKCIKNDKILNKA